MNRPTSSSPHWKAAARAIADRLSGQTKPVLLYDLSCRADTAARSYGRKTELFPSLYDYQDLLPANWTTSWIGGASPTSDRLLYAIPRGWKQGEVAPSFSSLLLGSREAHIVGSPDA